MSFRFEHSEEQFDQLDQLAETACKIKDRGVPIRHELSDSELFELFVSYGRLIFWIKEV